MKEGLTFESCLILGGARSGKTRRALTLAEDIAKATGKTPCYLATAQAFDDEMHKRIAAHQAERDGNWLTFEAPLEMPKCLKQNASADRVFLVDCLTLWLTNLILGDKDHKAATEDLIDALKDVAGPVIVVSNEVGLGIVPENALARRFRDEAGRLNQSVATAVDRVEFIAAGLPMTLKG